MQLVSALTWRKRHGFAVKGVAAISDTVGITTNRGPHQFTYFQQVGGLECKPVTGEITYGLERLAMYIQGVDSVYDLVWSDGPLGKTTYGDVFHQNEWGAMIADGMQVIFDQWWIAAAPGAIILIASLAFNLLGDGLRDVLEPQHD